MREKLLYHYCSTQKCFSILKNNNLRMSDIGKSNDYTELNLLFPRIFSEIEFCYREKPFNFEYEGLLGFEALSKLLNHSYRYWDEQFSYGKFYNYVVCFSESSDSLSQWRGYADDAKGCNIGFSKQTLESLCLASSEVLELTKVTYLVDEGVNKLCCDQALRILKQLKTYIRMIKIKFHNNEDEINTHIRNFLNYELEDAFTDSLKYKSDAFHEENEWRIYFKLAPSKSILKTYSKNDEAIDSLYQRTNKFIKEKIGFMNTDDDIISFCQLDFKDFYENPVKEIWLGPKNKARIDDVELFLQLNNYQNVNVFGSFIPYR